MPSFCWDVNLSLGGRVFTTLSVWTWKPYVLIVSFSLMLSISLLCCQYGIETAYLSLTTHRLSSCKVSPLSSLACCLLCCQCGVERTYLRPLIRDLHLQNLSILDHFHLPKFISDVSNSHYGVLTDVFFMIFGGQRVCQCSQRRRLPLFLAIAPGRTLLRWRDI